MASRLAALASGLALTGCSVVGIRTVETPPYQVIAQLGPIEVRSYGPRLVAEVAVGGDEIAARGTGFRLLAGYIFGANHGHAAISMTAPVGEQPGRATIAMTAPVDQARDPPSAGGGGQWRIRFTMPAQYTAETLPTPDDPRVQILSMPAQSWAVLRYSGSTAPTAVADASRRLLAALTGTGWTANGIPVAWFYDPPWTLPPLRRNEAAVPVTRAP